MRPRPISLWTQCHASAVFLVGDTSSQASLFLVIRLTCEAYQKVEVFGVVADIEPRFGRLDCESQKLRTSLSTSLVANLQAFTGSLKAVLEFLSTYIFCFSASRGGSKMSDKQVAYFQPGPSNYISLTVLPPAGMNFGPSMFANGAAWVVSCHWPNEERARWQSIQAQRELQHDSPPPYENLCISTEL